MPSGIPMNAMVQDNNDISKNINWLIFFRIIFTVFLLGSTIIVQQGQQLDASLTPSLIFLYGIIIGVFLLSIGYGFFLHQVTNPLLFAYIQISLDTAIVSLIIYATGGYSSIFSFLYLLVIVYSSLMIDRKGSLYIAALSSIQYGLLIDLEYYGVLKSFVGTRTIVSNDLSMVAYKIVVTMVACFAVALLSSLLAEQTRRSRNELKVMESHVRRVEQMAYMGEMAAGLAHEIKNPLAALTGSIQMLNEEISFNANNDKLMKIILREADRLSVLLTDFLLFAKPPAGDVTEIVVDNHLTEILYLFEKDMSACGRVVITTELIPDIRIAMDPSHFRQIFWNLLLNATESIADRGTVHIRMGNLQHDTVKIFISDTGQGISEEHIHLICNPFFTTKPNGTGLGLSIVHRLVENYGGRLDVESKVNQGTVIILTLKRWNETDRKKKSQPSR